LHDTIDRKQLAREWKQIKLLVKHYYADVDVRTVWKKLLNHRRQQFSNIALLVEVVLSIAVSNAYVESCFSFLTLMMSDRRLSMRHDTIANLLLIRANHMTWSLKQRAGIIDDAPVRCMSTRRKKKIET